MGKRQVNFWIDTELYKKFTHKCIDQEKSKTEVLVSFIKKFVDEK